MAAAAARRDLAGVLGVVKVGLAKHAHQNREKHLEAVMTQETDVMTEEADVMIQVTDEILNASTIEAIWEHPCGNEVYALAKVTVDLTKTQGPAIKKLKPLVR